MGNENHIHTSYVYGRKAVDWERKHPGKDYEHVLEDNKDRCCGFNAPRCAALFRFLDRPLALVEEFFERIWVNGGSTIEESAHEHLNSHIFDKVKKELKRDRVH